MALSSAQLEILNTHAKAGDRIAYYEALAAFGDPYGALALGVVRNDTISGASANTYFLNTASNEGVSVSENQLASISLELMLADNLVRQANGGTANVDEIQRYHAEVFDLVAGVSANAWTPNYYLESFSDFADRQVAWDAMMASNSFGTFAVINARFTTSVSEYFEQRGEHPPTTIENILAGTYDFLISIGLDASFADYIVGYRDYVSDLIAAGLDEVFFPTSNEHGNFNVGIPGAGQMVGGDQSNNDLSGNSGNDVIIGFDGNDTFDASSGTDRYYGGSGSDHVSYASADYSVIIQIGEIQKDADIWEPVSSRGHAINQVSKDGGAHDTLVDIAEVTATVRDDIFQLHGAFDEIIDPLSSDVPSIDGGAHESSGDTIDLSGITSASPMDVLMGNAGVSIIREEGSSSPATWVTVKNFENVIGSSNQG